MGLVKEFREFALKGNVVDLAVGVIIGGAFGKIVNSVVNDVIMPPLGLLTGGIDFKDKKIILSAAGKEGDKIIKPEAALTYGVFINTVLEFMIVAFAIFVMIKLMNEARKRFEKEQAAAPAPPPVPNPQEVLLAEIRDLLKSRP